MTEPDGNEAGNHRAGIASALLWLALVSLVAAFLYKAAVLGTTSAPESQKVAHVTLAAFTFLLLALWVHLSVEEDPVEPDERPEAWICKHCLKPFRPGAHFCPRCGCPHSFFAGTSPWERAWATAWCLGRAARGPRRPLTVAGFTAICLPGLASLALMLWFMSTHEGFGFRWLFPAPTRSPLELVAGVLSNLVALLPPLLYLTLYVRCLRSGAGPDEDAPAYGAPPWWTFDAHWALPEFEEDPGEADEPDAPAPPDPGE